MSSEIAESTYSQMYIGELENFPICTMEMELSTWEKGLPISLKNIFCMSLASLHETAQDLNSTALKVRLR